MACLAAVCDQVDGGGGGQVLLEGVGLTATPRDKIDRNTYRLLQLKDRVPTDEYSLAQAIDDKFLVPYRVLNTPARIPNGPKP